MQKKDTLFKLITALTPREKSYFRIFATTHASKKGAEQDPNMPNYFILYEVMNQLEIYDEQNVKAIFKKKLSNLKRKSTYKLTSTNFSFLKNRLQNRLLTAMTQFYAESTDPIIIRNLINEVDFLSKKSLFKEALKRLNKAKKLAEKNSLLPELAMILSIQRVLISRSQDNQQKRKLSENYEESILISRLLGEELTMSVLYQKIYSDQIGRTKVNPYIKLLQSEMQEMLTHKEIGEFSLRFQLDYHSAQSMILRLEGHQVKSLNHYAACLDIFDKNPQLIYIKEIRYLSFLDNYINRLFLNKQFEKIPERLASIQQFKFKQKGTDAWKFIFQTNGKLLYNLGKNNYQTIVDLAPEIERQLHIFQDKVNRSQQFSFSLILAVGFFSCRNFSGCQHWLNKILNHPKLNLSVNYRAKSLLLQILINLEEENYMIIDSLCQNLKRFYRENKGLNIQEHRILKVISKIFRDNTFKTKSKLQRKKSIENKIRRLVKGIRIPNSVIDGADAYLIWLKWYQKEK